MTLEQSCFIPCRHVKQEEPLKSGISVPSLEKKTSFLNPNRYLSIVGLSNSKTEHALGLTDFGVKRKTNSPLSTDTPNTAFASKRNNLAQSNPTFLRSISQKTFRATLVLQSIATVALVFLKRSTRDNNINSQISKFALPVIASKPLCPLTLLLKGVLLLFKTDNVLLVTQGGFPIIRISFDLFS
jgi:hypothetical protein